MKLYEAMASALIEEKVEHAFGLMGDGNMHFWGALLAGNKVKIHSARHEAAAVGMADGYFRATGDVGFAMITCGPGLTQVGTSLVCAARNQTPLVLMAGDAPVGQRHHVQRFDQRRFAEACEADHITVSKLEYAAEDIAEAFYRARANRRPVVLNVPYDLQDEELQWAWDYRSSLNYVRDPEAAAEADVKKLYEALVTSDKPVFIAGRGARNPRVREKLLRLGELVGALLGTSLQAKGLFQGEKYDIGISGAYASAPSEALFSDADFVLGIGAEIGYFTSEAGLMFPTAAVARIDIAPARKLSILPGLHVQGDAEKTVQRLIELAESSATVRQGYRTAETDAILASPRKRYEKSTDGLDARLLMRHLSYAIPSNALVTCGGGHFTSFAAMHLPIPKDVDFRVAIQFASIAQAIFIAIGVSVGQPQRPHIMIEGDGSLLMNMQELESIVRLGCQIVIVVLNDNSYGAEAHRLGTHGFPPSMAYYSTPDFVAVARAVGGDGVTIRKEEEITDAVKEGLSKGGLFVVEAKISPTEMCDDYKKLFHGQPNDAPLVRYEPSPKDFV